MKSFPVLLHPSKYMKQRLFKYPKMLFLIGGIVLLKLIY